MRHVIERQIEAGVDVGNNGEQPRIGFQTYVTQRMRGFGGESKRPTPQDLAEFPDFMRMLEARGMMKAEGVSTPPRPWPSCATMTSAHSGASASSSAGWPTRPPASSPSAS